MPEAIERPKIFCIGFNKCGTTSLIALLRANRIPSVHLGAMRPWGRLNYARQMHHNKVLGRPILDGIDEAVAYADLSLVERNILIDGGRFFRDFYREYRDAYFILNTRDMEAWVASRFAHKDLADRFCAALRCTREEIGDIWRGQFQAHHREVRRFFKNRGERFLEFNIETDDPQRLADLLAPSYAIDPAHWRRHNETPPAA